MDLRRLVFAAATFLASAAIGFAQQRPIREVRQNDDQGQPLLLGQQVAVTGVVTEAGHFGSWGPAYIRDSTGGVALYGSRCGGLAIGDSITVDATVDVFYGLTELKDLTIEDHGRVEIPQPEGFELARVGDIDTAGGYIENEARLVAFDRICIGHSPGERFQGDQNYTITDQQGDSAQMRIDRDASEIVGLLIPDDTIALIGIIGQFVSEPPYLGGYQVMPRTASDLGLSVQYLSIREAVKDEDHDGYPDRRGETVNVTGIVTVPFGVFAPDRLDIYVQDSSGGVNAFDWDVFETGLSDSVAVSGEVEWYRGKTEITNASLTILATGRRPPRPRTLTCREIEAEPYEGELVRLTGLTMTPATLEGNTNYTISDASGSTTMRIDADTDIPGLVVGPDTFSLFCIKSQFTPDTLNPFDGYQVLPRFRTDFSFAGAVEEPRAPAPGPKLGPTLAHRGIRIRLGNNQAAGYWELLDITGRRIARQGFAGSSAGEPDIDLRAFSPGVYLLRIDVGQGISTRRFVLR